MRSDFRFLYRESDGGIGPGLWARASALPVGVALAMTFIAWRVAPGVPRDLGSQPFFSLSIFAVHVYFIVYGFALIFLAVAQYFVSAKRYVDLGKSPSWAGLAPFSLLLAAAANWFQPRCFAASSRCWSRRVQLGFLQKNFGLQPIGQSELVSVVGSQAYVQIGVGERS